MKKIGRIVCIAILLLCGSGAILLKGKEEKGALVAKWKSIQVENIESIKKWKNKEKNKEENTIEESEICSSEAASGRKESNSVKTSQNKMEVTEQETPSPEPIVRFDAKLEYIEEMKPIFCALEAQMEESNHIYREYYDDFCYKAFAKVVSSEVNKMDGLKNIKNQYVTLSEEKVRDLAVVAFAKRDSLYLQSPEEYAEYLSFQKEEQLYYVKYDPIDDYRCNIISTGKDRLGTCYVTSEITNPKGEVHEVKFLLEESITQELGFYPNFHYIITSATDPRFE